MDITNLIVARYMDGRVLKGVTHDFSPNRAILHIDVAGTGQTIELRFRQLKALFFVRSLEGDPAREDVRGFVHGPAETQQGKKIAVRFRDGEFICGYTLSWSPDREGFFLFPADQSGNNQRIFVITASTLEIKAGPAAEVLAQRVLAAGTAEGGEPRLGREPRRAGPGASPLPGSSPPPASGRRASGLLPRPPHAGAPERSAGAD